MQTHQMSALKCGFTVDFSTKIQEKIICLFKAEMPEIVLVSIVKIEALFLVVYDIKLN